MHSSIEQAAKNKSIFTQNQWVDIIQSAKVNPPKYIVYELTQNDIFNFSKLVKKTKWKKIPISRISTIKVDKNYVTYEETFTQAETLAMTNNDQIIEVAYKKPLELDGAN